MQVINVITALCLVALALEIIIMALSYATKSPAERVEFLRSFKKGKCVIIYIIAIPLYCVGMYYGGKTFLNSFFGAIGEIVNLVVLKYSTSNISALMDANAFYSFTVYAVFFTVALNAVLLSLSLFGQRIWCFFRSSEFYLTRKKRLVIFGYNGNSVNVYKSDKTHSKIITGEINDKESVKLYANKIAYANDKTHLRMVDLIFKKLKRGAEFTAIINTENDELNLKLANAFVDRINALSQPEKRKLFLRFKVFVFGDHRYSSIYEDVSSAAYGCMTFVDKYQKIAVDFADKYPLTRFMNEKHIDYATSLVKPDADINVILIGFGKANRQIFLTSVANNQFITQGKGGVVAKNVRYVIFDKVDAQNNKNLNFDYYRFKNEVKSADGYLPLPDMPANEEYRKTDINSVDFYNGIKDIVTKNPNSVNSVIIAFASDLENIDMGQKLLQKQAEWGIDNLTVFIKAKNVKKEQTSLEQQNCYFIGNEKDVVYDIEKITADRMQEIAKKRNEYYFVERALIKADGRLLDQAELDEISATANEKQYTQKTRIERESGLYCCLSLRSKLHMMGLDYDFGRDGLSKEEYLKIYKTGERPFNMAIHEHYRWNSFMICKGMIPSTIDDILNETATDENGDPKHTNGKNYALRRHGNITTYDGLMQFKKMIAERDGISQDSADVFKYDYQLLDHAFEVLDSSGGKIIKKAP